MLNLVPSPAHRSMWNCDNCSKSRVKCCKSIPRCSQCARRNISCTYSKVHKKKRTMAEHPDFYSHTTSFTLSKSATPKRANLGSNITFKFYQPSIPNSPVNSKWVLRPIVDAYHFRWVHMLKVWCLFKPIDHSKTPTMSTFLSIFSSVISNEPIPQNFACLQSLEELICHPSLFPAVSAYFKYANLFLPLFTERDFLSRPRSLLLVMAVWVRGLLLLPNDFCSEHFRVSLQAQLVTRLRAAYTQVNLDTIQSLLVTLNGLQSYRWSGTSTGLFYGAIVDIAHCLGLHRPPPKNRLPPHVLLERRLAYSCILFIDSLQSWNMDTHCMVCVEHATPRLFQTSLSSIYKLGLGFDPQGAPIRTSGAFLKRIPDLSCSIMADSLAHTAIIFQSMNLCRHQIAHNTKNLFLVFRDLQRLKRELQKMFKYHTNLFRLLLSQKDMDRTDRELLQLCRLHLNIQFHTLSHDVFTLSLKATYSPFNFDRSPDLNLHFEYTQALNAASRVVKLDQLLGEDPYHMYRVQFLANAIVFLIHNHRKHPEPDNVLETLSLGCRMMDRLKTHPTYRLMATLAQTLINKHLQVYKIAPIIRKPTNGSR